MGSPKMRPSPHFLSPSPPPFSFGATVILTSKAKIPLYCPCPVLWRRTLFCWSLPVGATRCPYQMPLLLLSQGTDSRILACECRRQGGAVLWGWDWNPSVGKWSLLTPPQLPKCSICQPGVSLSSPSGRGLLSLVYLVNQLCPGQHCLLTSSQIIGPVLP